VDALPRNYEEKYRSKATKNVLKHTILYVHCVDLLIWSPTQLGFPFYDFSAIFYDISKLLGLGFPFYDFSAIFYDISKLLG
jgi:hypothetical protein